MNIMQNTSKRSLNMAGTRVTLASSDNEMFDVEPAVASESQMLKDMISDTGADSPIPVPNVSGRILAKVIEYCKYHVENQKTSEDRPATPEDDIKAWDAEFVKVDQQTLYDLILVCLELLSASAYWFLFCCACFCYDVFYDLPCDCISYVCTLLMFVVGGFGSEQVS